MLALGATASTGIVSSGGVSSSAMVNGSSGAHSWAIIDAAGLTSITITSETDFAVGELGIAKKDGGAVPDPGSSLLLLGLGLAGLAWRKRASSSPDERRTSRAATLAVALDKCA